MKNNVYEFLRDEASVEPSCIYRSFSELVIWTDWDGPPRWTTEAWSNYARSDTIEVGAKWLKKTLTENNFAKLAFDIVTENDSPKITQKEGVPSPWVEPIEVNRYGEYVPMPLTWANDTPLTWTSANTADPFAVAPSQTLKSINTNMMYGVKFNNNPGLIGNTFA